MTEPPFLLVVAGPNGSGKTTLTNRLRSIGLDFGTYINADEIAARLQRNNRAAAPEASRQAQIEADTMRRAKLDARESYSFETVMSHPSKIQEMLEARRLGFDVRLFFVGVDDPAINVSRVAQRVARGGHDVPLEKILARYKRTMELLPQAMRAANRATIYDNSDLEVGPQRIAWSHWERDKLIIHVKGSLEKNRWAMARPWFKEYGLRGVASLFHAKTSVVDGVEIKFEV
jgi:predicted ABC-type ATPase